MKHLAIVIVLAALVSITAESQTYDLEKAVLVLTGASSMEDLAEDIMEDYHSLSRHPLKINAASESTMVSSGLFTRYQAASVHDYRKRSGDILSVHELMLVDGFDESTALALSVFVSFASDEPAGRQASGNDKVSGETVARSSVRYQSGTESWSHSLKLKLEQEERWSASFAAKGSAWPPESISGSVSYSGKRWSAVAGDFNTRFGQGLLLWSGFSLSGAQSAASFAKHPSGLSPAWTLSPGAAHRGAAAELMKGRFLLSGFWSMDSTTGANLTYLARNGQLGATALACRHYSADWRWSFGKLDSFGEVAYDAVSRGFASVAGITFNPAYQVRFSAIGRWYPDGFDGSRAGAFRSSTKTSDERGVAFAFDGKSFSVTADAAFHPSKGTSQHKAVIKYSPQVSDRLSLALRYTSRYRPEDNSQWRNEGRAEVGLTVLQWFLLRGCVDVCRCKDTSWLAFAEAGFKSESEKHRVQAYARLTAFVVDNWDDRIYIYERDVPGAFSVPAYYGRGYSLSGVVGYKWKRSFSANARLSALEYPGMIEKKPGKTGLNIQLLWDF